MGRDIIEAAVYPGYYISDYGVWHDIGFLVLDQAPPPGIERYQLYRDEDEVGQSVELTGYGGSDGEFHTGQNTIQSLGTEVLSHGSLEEQLAFDYDSGHKIAPGDSGGGMFIQEQDPLLAGLHSYTANTDPKSSEDDVGVATRISSYADWIDVNTGVVQDPLARSSSPPPEDSVPMQVQEGQGVWFLVKLGNPAQEKATVDFQTRDGSAEAGYDYVPTEGTLTLEPGEQWAKVWVQTLADDLIEGEEDFSLVLTNPEGASFPDGAEELSAERTIEDDVSLAGVTELQPELFNIA